MTSSYLYSDDGDGNVVGGDDLGIQRVGVDRSAALRQGKTMLLELHGKSEIKRGERGDNRDVLQNDENGGGGGVSKEVIQANNNELV